jgi:two-component system, sensor histidine kinase and response regulator
LFLKPHLGTIALMKHNVLCIDDETHNLEALERLLRKKYNTFVADSGAKALEILEKEKFSLIISDQKMPHMTGVEFFMIAKQKQPDAMRVLLTGYTDLESVINAINQGQIYRYITKPWEPEEFLSIAQQALEVFEMKKTIVEQNQQLLLANEELKKLDQLKTDFMLLVNHELKTPLTGIFSFVQLLGEETMPPDQKLYLNKIEKNTRRLQELINDTLLITKLKSQVEGTTPASVDLTQLLKDQWESITKENKDKKLKLNLKNNQPVLKNIDPKYIGIITKKLMQNSFAHSQPDTEVTYEIIEEAHQWKLQTQNILAKELKKDPKELLQAFNTAKNILNHSGGSGLGLSVIQSILQLFSGEIQIQTKDKMFEVTLCFPN